jgi:4-hydroxy-3-polyprenylbenzoate decarboxylase
VTLKERRPLVMLVRETPLHLGHLRLMTQAAEIGAVICPPVPAFYTRPESIEDLVDHTVVRALEHLGVAVGDIPRWGE